MNYISFEITLAAIIPAIALCGYIYHKDRIEKEPFGLLLLLFCTSAVLALPVILLQDFLLTVLNGMFDSLMGVTSEGFMEFTSTASMAAYEASRSFVIVALIETTLKWLVMFLITKNNKNFNSLFDGIVYAVFVSLGFAALENVRFAWINGWDLILIRSFVTVPVQMFAGVFMGCYYTIWHVYKFAAKTEKALASEGLINIEKPFSSSVWIVLSYAAPLMVQGIYSFTEAMPMKSFEVLFYIFVVLLYVFCFVRIRKMSAADAGDNKVVVSMLLKKYPELSEKNSFAENGIRYYVDKTRKKQVNND